MSAFVVDLLKRLTSRGFLAAAASYSIVLTSGLGWAHFEDGVVLAATGALITYIGAKAGADVAASRKNGVGPT